MNSYIHSTNEFNEFEIEEKSSLLNFKKSSIRIKSVFNKLISRLFFIWIIPVLKRAHYKTLKPNILPNISSKLNSRKFLNDFTPFWKDSLHKKLKYPLFQTCLKSNFFNWFLIFFLSMFDTFMKFLSVYFFKQIILNFKQKNNDIPTFPLNISIVLLLISKFIIIFLTRQIDYIIDTEGCKLAIQLDAIMYDKLLKSSGYDKDGLLSEGALLNYIQYDSEEIAYFFSNWPCDIFIPLQILFYSVILFRYFGKSFLIGLATLIILMYFSTLALKAKTEKQTELMKLKDERLKTTTEVFNMLKVLKLYSWEEAFKKKILKRREKELNKLREIENISLFINTVYWSSTTIISVISIVVYNLFYEQMNISNIMTAIYIFNSLADPLFNLPGFFMDLFDLTVAIKRVEKYLLSRNYNSNQISHIPDSSEYSIIIDKCDFGIKEDDKEVVLLKNISLKIKKGNLIGVFGEVGSGKTLLLNSFLNNLDVLNKQYKGNIHLYGSISYISQTPWILNDTLKNNILFFNEFNEERYKNIIKICELEQDIKIIDGGDMAEIGEKGVNLSGGQKARIAIARALYANADIYLFDDPLSAVDAYVGLKLFNNVFKKYLKGKTVILVTHALQYLNGLDQAILMKDRRIELFEPIINLKNSIAFKEFCTNTSYLNLKRKKSTDLDNEIINNVLNDKYDKNNIENEKISNIDNTMTPLTGFDIIDSNSNKELKNILNNDNEKKKLLKTSKKVKRITKDEKIQKGAVKLKVWMKYFTYIGGITFFISTLISNILWKTCEVKSDYILTEWASIEKITESENFKYLIYYSIVSLFGIFFVFFRALLASNSVIKYNTKMHNLLLDKLIDAPINLFHDTIPRSQILNRLSRDLDKSTKLCWTTNGYFRIVFQLLSCIFVCINFNWFILFLLPIIFAIDYNILNFYLKGGRDLNRLGNVSVTPIISVFSETIPGISTIRAYNYEDKFKEKCFVRLNNDYKIIYYRSGGECWFGLILDLVSFILLLVILILANIFKKKLTPQSLGLLISYSMKLIDYLFNFMTRFIKLEKHITSVERCNTFLEIDQEKYFKCDNDELLKNNFPLNGKVEFRNYSVKYRPDTPIVLNNLNFILNPHEKIGVVGRTGSGKSTLCLCLFRILEAFKGQILIDDIDIKTIGLRLLRQSITIIPQEPVLLEGNIRENVDPLNVYTDSEIENVLQEIGLDHLKLFYPVEENGKNLSVGEKQLICIGRAVLRKTKVVVMDEATSSIDYKTENLIQNVINTTLRDSTVITIAHRIKTVINYDRIMVMSNGELVEFDSPKKLLENPKGIFTGLYKESIGNNENKNGK